VRRENFASNLQGLRALRLLVDTQRRRHEARAVDKRRTASAQLIEHLVNRLAGVSPDLLAERRRTGRQARQQGKNE
jgi:hypothetical protein